MSSTAETHFALCSNARRDKRATYDLRASHQVIALKLQNSSIYISKMVLKLLKFAVKSHKYLMGISNYQNGFALWA
jgi:hypothetical protein